MMQYLALLAWCCLLVGRISAAPFEAKQSDLKDFTFDEIIPNQFGLRGFNGTWLSGEELLYRNGGDYVKLNVNTGDSVVVITTDVLSQFRGASIQLIKPDFTKVLVRYDVRTVFRHSSLSKYAIYDTLAGTTYHVANQEEVSICILSPTGQSLAYVKDNNVYYRESLVDPVERPLTLDGVPGVIYNGIPDWVYEEEVFGTDATLWFSPNGRRLAMASFDDREVKEFTYHLYGSPDDTDKQYPEELRIRYPKVNTTNPTVHLRVTDLSAGEVVWVELPAPLATVGEDHVLGTVNWAGEDVLGVIWTNRRQNVASFQKCATTDGTCTEAIRFDRPNGWYDLYTPRCYSADRCFLMGDNNGWRAVMELVGEGATAPIARTPAGFTVSSINGYDEASQALYYTAVPASEPHHRHVYRNEECLTCGLKDELEDSAECNFASASFSADLSYMAATCSGPTPSYTQIYRTSDRQLVADWELNLERREQLKQYKQVSVRFLRVPVGDGNFQASVRLYLPPEIDFESPATAQTRKYPMVVNVYAGPDSVRVTDSFSVGFANYMATTKGVIYAQIDGRGTGNQGYEFLFSINNQLGTYEMEDQIAVARYLQETYTFIDPQRTGIWGSSYGGYATAMTLEKDHEQVFRCGISVAPVTSWMFYDSIYTERYMGRPTDNGVGYEKSDISGFTDELKNHLFLLIHGTADDNVHYQQSMVFVRALLDHDIDFEQMTYPDEAHSLSGVQRHLYHTMDQFWDRCFE
ncbi:venom dipeptidyl peptidase 4 [Anopheles maculipalpis]|uniref:venom dipeptidyl peptidase 4 n=1 Tax=Anopheles maculipalpis TaxID=1496333 RepID=UPI002159B56A|nr:venom dipeptidyl peptidase 4 [Anopheles maculipalpis]